jgi:opacity protein-like surface antigen
MKGFTKRALLAALLAGVGTQALAADLAEPPVIEAPPAVEYQPAPAFGGWYIRGDVDYHWNDFRDADYYTYRTEYDDDGNVIGIDGRKDGRLKGDLDESWSVGAGVGYQISDHLRTDVTLDYLDDADFNGHTKGYCEDEDGTYKCSSNDSSSFDAWLLLANAYAELGTYHGFTPYIGAGIGGAYVRWDDLHNSIDYRDGHNETVRHEGNDDWRFAWALMAGTSYCLTGNLEADLGYRFARVEDGEMFGFKYGAGPGHDDGVNVHEVKAGVRYNFGGPRPACAPPEPVAYEPPVEPVYK